MVGVGAPQEINNGEGNVHFLEQMINKRFVRFEITFLFISFCRMLCPNPNNLKVIREKKKGSCWQNTVDRFACSQLHRKTEARVRFPFLRSIKLMLHVYKHARHSRPLMSVCTSVPSTAHYARKNRIWGAWRSSTVCVSSEIRPEQNSCHYHTRPLRTAVAIHSAGPGQWWWLLNIRKVIDDDNLRKLIMTQTLVHHNSGW